MYKKLKLVESTSDRYQVREYDGPGAKFGAYDTKTKKFVQKGSKKVMTAACEDLNNKNKKLTEGNFDKAQAVLPLDNYHAMGIIVSDNGETVQYMYSNDEDKVYESEIEFDEEGNPFFRDENGEIWMISDFMRTNFGESIIYNTKANLTEADDEELEDIQDDAKEDLENQEELEDTVDSEEDQEENPVEEESELDTQLNELRDILVDLDLNLYQITDKEDLNNSVYIIGKVAEDSDEVLMLVDTKPEDINSEEIPEEEPIINNVDIDDNINEAEEVVSVLRNPENSNERVEIKKLPNGKYQTLYYSDEKSFSGVQSQFDDLDSAISQAQKLRPTYKLDEVDNNTYSDEDEAAYYRNKELYANSNLSKHRKAMEKAAKACKEKGIKLKESLSWNEEMEFDLLNQELKGIKPGSEESKKPEIKNKLKRFSELMNKINEAEEIPDEESKEDEHKTELEQRFDFVKLPNTFEEINKLNPRYGEELTPDHESIVEYLMNCLIEINPEAAEELQNNEEDKETPIESEEDIDLDIDINREEDLNNEDQY